MSDQLTSNTSPGEPGDPRHDALHAEWLGHRRAYETREAEHHEVLDRQRGLYDSVLNRKHKQADAIENIELDRLDRMRPQRAELDAEVVVAHDLAAKAFAQLGLGYVAGVSRVDDLYRIEPLPESIAADRAGVPIASTTSDGLLKVLKFAGLEEGVGADPSSATSPTG